MPATPIKPAAPPNPSPAPPATELAPDDFYLDGPYLVFTAGYHLKRGYCCNSGCRHCPFHDPLGQPSCPDPA